MKRRVALITEIIAPYRIPVFNALAENSEIDLHVIFLSETDSSLRQWHVYKSEIRFSCSVLNSRRWRVGGYNLLLQRGLSKELERFNPDVVICGGYSYLASWEALYWARRRRTPFVLWSESTLMDQRSRRSIVEMLKRFFVRKCDGFLVPGTAQRNYLEKLGADPQQITTAPNAVDNDFFASGARLARADQASLRKQLQLPARYFLFVGRLVLEKGVFELLEAYVRLEASIRSEVGLVFAGDGPARLELEQRAAEVRPGSVMFPGFVQRQELPAYYALAEALVLPTYSDPWGLVVNEAMACGLAVVVTSVAGCAADLVEHGNTGIVVASPESGELSQAMRRLALQPELTRGMGANGEKRIQNFSPRSWAAGVGQSMKLLTSMQQ